MSTSPADHLRARARTLRRLASDLQQLQLLALPPLAGNETWMGPSPQRCADALRLARVAVLDRADELVHTARRFEREADELAALTRLGVSR